MSMDEITRLVGFWQAEARDIANSSRSYDFANGLLKCAKDLADALASVTGPREQCICAAIQLPSGELFRGHRHDDAIRVAGGAGVSKADIYAADQGFITSLNRYVGREEGAALQRAAGIVSAQTGQLPEGMLFSEDLYLRPKGSSVTGEQEPLDLAAMRRVLDQDQSLSLEVQRAIVARLAALPGVQTARETNVHRALGELADELSEQTARETKK